MRLRNLVVGACAAGAIALVACGGGIESSCGNYFDAGLALSNQCGVATAVDSSAKTNFQKLCDALAVAPGVQNLGSQIDACTSLYSSADCQSSLRCSITGTLASGAACADGIQCASGLCSTSSAQANKTSELVCGQCADYVEVGGDCTNGGTCDPQTGECGGGTCVAYAKQGESCAAAPCGSDLFCDPSSNTCATYPAKGQACTVACAAPYRCVGGQCGDGVAENGACPTGTECASGLTCDAESQTCAAAPTAAENEPCGFVNNQIVDCQKGLKCAQSGPNAFVCITPKALGAACTVGNFECQTYLLCIGGTCQFADYAACK